MLLARHACHIHQFPADHYWQNCASMAGEPLKTHTLLPIGQHPDLLGLFSVSAVSPVAGTHTYCPMACGQLSSFILGILWTTPGGLQGFGLKGGAVPPGVYLTIPPLHQSSHPPSWGTHTTTTSLYVQLGSCPHLRLHPHHLPPGRLFVDAVSMRGWAIG